MSNLLFRNATINDLQAIVKIYNSTVAGRMVTADTEPVSVESKVNWFNEHTPNKRPLWIVENDQKDVVAWVSFNSFYGRPAYDVTVELSIYIDEHYRGKGFGKAILAHAMQEAPKFGIKTLLGYIFAHNLPSLKLFYAFGFTNWGNFPKIALLDGDEKDLIIVGKRIA